MKALKKALITFLSIIILVSSKVEKREKFLLVETKGDEGGKNEITSLSKCQYLKGSKLIYNEKIFI